MLKIKLSNGQDVELNEEDVKNLKPIIDEAFSKFDESVYKRLRGSSPAEVIAELSEMSDDDLLNLAKANDLNPRGGQAHKSFTIKIWAEFFKRNAIGKPTGRNLSFKQSAFLQRLGLKTKHG
ncbi:MAG: hypothetical protein WCJ72_09635 [Chryseobacterium sp.]